mmetsp:Transcript_148569/g.386283  ORF Transcript_148569/g.386283 Transcript_148569/m.386283 type:complete len:81 (+) Transcript_148569:312-554(+)
MARRNDHGSLRWTYKFQAEWPTGRGLMAACSAHGCAQRMGQLPLRMNQVRMQDLWYMWWHCSSAKSSPSSKASKQMQHVV